MNAEDAQAPESESVAERIARILGNRIVTGALAPGTPVRQDHVASQFRASHIPVREAFRKLEAQGLLVAEPRRGVRVAPVDAAAVVEVTAMRAALEVLALRRSFPRLGRRELERARDALAESAKSDSVAVWEQANRRFHRAVTAPCAMPRLLAAIDDLHRASARYLFLTWRTLDWQSRSDREHQAILAALEAGDIDAAAVTLDRHIVEAGNALVDRIGASNADAAP